MWSLMPRSVDSTVISLMVRISVVLPAANGPVMTTLTAWPPCRRRCLVAMSEPPHAGDESQHQTAIDCGITFDCCLACRCGSCRHTRGTTCCPCR